MRKHKKDAQHRVSRRKNEDKRIGLTGREGKKKSLHIYKQDEQVKLWYKRTSLCTRVLWTLNA